MALCERLRDSLLDARARGSYEGATPSAILDISYAEASQRSQDLVNGYSTYYCVAFTARDLLLVIFVDTLLILTTNGLLGLLRLIGTGFDNSFDWIPHNGHFL